MSFSKKNNPFITLEEPKSCSNWETYCELVTSYRKNVSNMESYLIEKFHLEPEFIKELCSIKETYEQFADDRKRYELDNLIQDPDKWVDFYKTSGVFSEDTVLDFSENSISFHSDWSYLYENYADCCVELKAALMKAFSCFNLKNLLYLKSSNFIVDNQSSFDSQSASVDDTQDDEYDEEDDEEEDDDEDVVEK